MQNRLRRVGAPTRSVQAGSGPIELGVHLAAPHVDDEHPLPEQDRPHGLDPTRWHARVAHLPDGRHRVQGRRATQLRVSRREGPTDCSRWARPI